MKSPAWGAMRAAKTRERASGYSGAEKTPSSIEASSTARSPSTSQRSPRRSASCVPGPEAQLLAVAFDDRLAVVEAADELDPLDLPEPPPHRARLGSLPFPRQQVDVRGAAGRADRELGQLGFVVGGGEHGPVAGQHVGQRQAAVDRRLGVVGEQDHGVAGEELVDPAGGLDQLGEAVVGLGDRLDARLRPVAVRVIVVVGQREQQEVVAVVALQLGGAAGRVAVAVAGDRGRLAGHLAAGVEVAVEELARAPGVVAELQPRRLDRAPQQAVERDLVPVAAAVDQEGRAGGAQRRRRRGARRASRPRG